jgi:hypothetical protein
MEFQQNPTLFKADTQTLHFRIESMLHQRGGEKVYNNLKLCCFKTDKKNQRIDFAEFYLHYAKLRAILGRIAHMATKAAFRDKIYVFNFTAEVPSASSRTLRNLTIYFEPAEKISFVFSDGKHRGAPSGIGTKMTGSLAFHLSLKYEMQHSAKESRTHKLPIQTQTNVVVPEQLQKFDELLLLGESINALERIYGTEIFKLIRFNEKTSKGE